MTTSNAPDGSDLRDVLMERLMVDLMGPADPAEIISDRPSDRYVTGIIFPTRTSIADEEDEKLEGEDSSDDAGTPPDQVSLSATMRPSSAGLSFATSALDGAPGVRFHVRCGTYVLADSRTVAADSRTGKGQKWQRIPHVIGPIDISIAESVPPVDLAAFGLPGLELYLEIGQSGATRLVTAVLVNRQSTKPGEGRDATDERSFFQVELTCHPLPGTLFPARPSRRAVVDDDSQTAALLYRNAREFATGHTCSARMSTSSDGAAALELATTWFPVVDVASVSAEGGEELRRFATDHPEALNASWLASATPAALSSALQGLPDAYARWIDSLRSKLPGLPASLRGQALAHLSACDDSANRMREAAAAMLSDDMVRTAFQLANNAMNMQYVWARGADSQLRWRPFQLGFLLQSLSSAADASHKDRSVMDLLWFPTGGGKTEAYLGLVAFVLFHRRLRSPQGEGGGVAAFMRYTLRLLTTQQFQRAAALILACDTIRKSQPSLGSEPISIGLWVGGDAVANTRAEAFKALEQNLPNRPDQVDRCPACGGRLLWQRGPRNAYLRVSCPAQRCVLGGSDLPIWTVDEDVYERLPSLLIGTVDKFAQVVRWAEVRRFFGVDTKFLPPDLIIQDELHLISGPLGTLAGLYEVCIDQLCSREGSRPKIIGSTATIRRAPEQIRALFDRTAALFPPPGLDADDSCFAVAEPAFGRRYSATTTAGRSAKFTLQAVSASLLQAVGEILRTDARADAYATLVCYFNALRELGGAVVLMQDDVPGSLTQLAARRRGESARLVPNVAELTSRVSQAELKERLHNLAMPSTGEGAVDVLLATNMISVGIDIPRLGLMVVNGQPKSVAEYIQATSRVGRGGHPGLVMTIYNNNKARDRSRFETFSSWHSTLYREVEATSVTPFAARARDRAIHAVLVGLARHLIPALRSGPLLAGHEPDLRRLAEDIVARCRSQDAAEAEETELQLQALIDVWSDRQALTDYWDDYHPDRSLLISAERAATLRAGGANIGEAWPTPNTMRSVEAATRIVLLDRVRANVDA